MKMNDGSLTDAQFRGELERCIYCEEKPCQEACPAHCSPADFIMAARVGEKSDYRRAAALIMGSNPLGWVCGVACPDYFCMKACSRRTFDRPIEIPAVQATVIKKANEAGMAKFRRAEPNGKTVGIIGAGPAGLGAASVLSQDGYRVTIYEQQKRLGGAMNLIPDFRLDKQVVRADIAFLKSLGDVEFKLWQDGRRARKQLLKTLRCRHRLRRPGRTNQAEHSRRGTGAVVAGVSGKSKEAQAQRQKGRRPRRRRGGGGLRDDGQTPRRCFRRIDLSPPGTGHAADAIRARHAARTWR